MLSFEDELSILKDNRILYETENISNINHNAYSTKIWADAFWRRRKNHSNRFDPEIEIVTKHHPSKVLEIGSAYGRVTRKLIESINQTAELSGIELNPHFEEYAKNYAETYPSLGSVEFIFDDFLDFQKGSGGEFDLIVLPMNTFPGFTTDVLSNLFDAVKINLEVDGKFIFSTHKFPQNLDKYTECNYSGEFLVELKEEPIAGVFYRFPGYETRHVEYDDSYFHPLQDLIKDQDKIDQQETVTSIVGNWLEDWIVNVYNMYTQPRDLGNSLYTGIQVVYDSDQVDAEDLGWIVNEESIVEEMGELLQSTSVDVSIEFMDIKNDSVMNQFINQGEVSYASYRNAASPFDNWTYYDGGYFHDQMIGNIEVRDRYFETPGGYDLSLNGLIILLDNASFVGKRGWIPWSGGLYTGLGGTGRTAILYELDRAFMPDMSKKSGLSKILIHELGHAVGLPHTFYNRFTSDFSNEVMGYYPGTHQFSEIVKQAYWSELVLNKIRYLQTITSSYDSNFVNIQETKFEELVNEFRAKDFVDAYNLAMEILDDISNGYSTETSETITSNTVETVETSTVDFRIMAVLPLNLIYYLIWKKRS